MLWIVILVMLGLIVVMALVLFKRKPGHHHPAAVEPSEGQLADPPPSPVALSRKYWGKQFVVPMTDNACAAARELNGQAFAMGQTPKLPLVGCDHVGCDCHFEPLLERRSGEERRHGLERREAIRYEDAKADRRTKPRRHDDDNYNWHYTA